MANTKISQLPSWTGSANDLRWFVMNNSGETTTYKFSGYTSPFIVDAGNSIFSTFGTPAVYNPTQCVGSVVIGSEAVAYDDYSTVIGWKAIGNNDIEGRCVALGADAQAQGRFTTALGMSTRVSASNATAVGYNATASADGSVALGHTSTASAQNAVAIGKGVSCAGVSSAVIAGSGNINSGSLSGIFGGLSNTIGANAAFIGGGRFNTVDGSNGDSSYTLGSQYAIAQGVNSGVLGGWGSYVYDDGVDEALGWRRSNIIIASPYCEIGVSSNTGRNFGGIYSSLFSYIRGTAGSGTYVATIIGSSASTINGGVRYSSIIGGDNNLIDNSNNSQILGGSNNTINCETAGNERFNTIINGSGNTIFDAADNQTLQSIINSVNTTLQNGTQRVTAIGLSGRTINDASAGITYVETLKAFSQVVEGFYDNGTMTSGAGPAITINVDNGSKQQVTITGGTNFIYFTGNLTGGRLVLKVINTGTGGINWSDAAPRDWKLPASNPSSQPTHNATDIFVFESFDNASLWLTTHSENLS